MCCFSFFLYYSMIIIVIVIIAVTTINIGIYFDWAHGLQCQIFFFSCVLNYYFYYVKKTKTKLFIITKNTPVIFSLWLIFMVATQCTCGVVVQGMFYYAAHSFHPRRRPCMHCGRLYDLLCIFICQTVRIYKIYTETHKIRIKFTMCFTLSHL